MLIKVKSQCPECEATLQLTVSAGERGKTLGSTTRCSACGEKLITETVDGVRVVVAGRTRAREFMLAIDPTSGGARDRPQQKYFVFAPIRLDLFSRGRGRSAEISGVSDEDLANKVTQIDEGLFWRPNGTPRTPAEAARHVGWRAVWVAQLNQAIRERLAGPPPITAPPTIFVSYRWGDADQIAWAAALAAELKRRGYPVVFDRDEPKTDKPDVPRLVSRIAECRYMLCVIDPGYVERLGAEGHDSVRDGWVFDEVNTARLFSNSGHLSIVGLLRDGETLPSGFTFMQPNAWGNTVDVRNRNALLEFLDDAFPDLPVKHAGTTVLAAQRALGASHAAFLAGDLERAFAEANRVVALLPDAPDGFAQQIRLAMNTGTRVEDGLRASHTLLGRVARSTELHAAAAALHREAGMLGEAARHARLAIEQSQKDPELGVVHTVLADVLDERDSLDAALAHGREAIRLMEPNETVLTNVGYFLRRLNRPRDALELFEQALALAPRSVNVLSNAAGAAFEAGLYDRLQTYADRLAEIAPDSPSAKFFRDLRSEPGLRPQPLIPLAPDVPAQRMASCTSCQASIRLRDGDWMCAGCGAPRSEEMLCPVCSHDGILIRGLSTTHTSLACPVCRSGILQVSLPSVGTYTDS